jgi:hypothetical protein
VRIATRSKRRSLAALGLAAAVATIAAVATAAPAMAKEGSIVGAGGADAIKDGYIVVLKDTASPVDVLAGRLGGLVQQRFTAALQGYSATSTPAST